MSEKIFIDKIKSPQDIKQLSTQELNILSQEIRDAIVTVVSQNGGHLASNLGVVELTVAIHKVFDTPKDKIVWDVGHQCYAHKILTGRYGVIDTIRKEGGISGFPKREESEYDSFDVGHSSTSISAAYGLSAANCIKKDDSYVVAVIGDGALSGGLAYEGLNNAGRSKKNFIVILNDNKMSISKNVGSMARYLSSIRIKPSYLNAKSRVQRFLNKIPVIGKPLNKFIKSVKNFLKKRLLKHKNTLFEDLGFKYYGPFDGHNIDELTRALNGAKQIKGPVLIHVITTKGKGYEFAEQNPKDFHGTAPFDIETGLTKECKRSFSDVFGDTLCDIAKNDSRVCAITAAMQLGTGLSRFAQQYKNRFFDVGIAEEHAVTFAAGLSANGMIPVFAVYSTFLQRSYDQIIHDTASQNLHIVLAVDRAGIVGEDGQTHQGLFDAAFLNTIPNVSVFCPCYFDELEAMLKTAVFDEKSTVVVRYPKGCEPYKPQDFITSGGSYDIYGDKSSKTTIVTYGRLFSYACKCLEKLAEKGISARIIKLNRIKPLDISAVKEALISDSVFFFEEGIQSGGIGEHFCCKLCTLGYKGDYTLTAIDDRYVPQASVLSSLKKYKLDGEGMADVIFKKINL